MDADPHPTANPMGSLVRDQFQSHLDHYQELVELFNASSKKDLAALYESVDGHVKEALPDPIDPKRKENIRKMVKARLVAAKPRDAPNKRRCVDAGLLSFEKHQSRPDASGDFQRPQRGLAQQQVSRAHELNADEIHRARPAAFGEGYVRRDQSRTYVTGSQGPRRGLPEQSMGTNGLEFENGHWAQLATFDDGYGGRDQSQTYVPGSRGAQRSRPQQVVSRDAEWELEERDQSQTYVSGSRRPQRPMSQQAGDVGAALDLEERPSGYRSRGSDFRKPRHLMSQQAVDVGAEWDLEEDLPPEYQPHGYLPQHAGGKSREDRREDDPYDMDCEWLGNTPPQPIIATDPYDRRVSQLLDEPALPGTPNSVRDVRARILQSLGMEVTPTCQATNRGFSVALKLPGSGWTVEEATAPSAISQALLERLLGHISGSDARVSTWDSMPVMQEACILTRVIGKVKTGSFKDVPLAQEACAKCLGRDAGSGRKSVPRPCAGLLVLEGVVTIGFLPLPPVLRGGKEASELGFWIRNA